MKEPELRKTPRLHYVYVIEVIADKNEKPGATKYFNPGLGRAGDVLALPWGGGSKTSETGLQEMIKMQCNCDRGHLLSIQDCL